MDRDADQKPAKKTWETPVVRQVALTEDERAQLGASQDPIALLFEIRPDVKPSDPTRPKDVPK